MTQFGAPGTGDIDTNLLHQRDDVDNNLFSHHHTLGIRSGQSSPGDHIHDNRTSKQLLLNAISNRLIYNTFLGEVDNGTAWTHTTGAVTTMATLNVTIPSGLPSGTRVELIATFGQLATPAGVGAIIALTNASIGRDFTSGGSTTWTPPTLIKWDLNPTSGAKTYTLTLQTTVSGNTVTVSRGVTLAARILPVFL